MLLDRYRLLRSFVVGLLMSVPLALLCSVHLLSTFSWFAEPPGGWMNGSPSSFFSLRERVDHLLERTIGLNLLVFAIISLCLGDLGPQVNDYVLPRDLRILFFFFFVLLILMALHHGFAVHSATLHFKRKSGASDSAGRIDFELKGRHLPVFFDFLYVAYTVGMTFEMQMLVANNAGSNDGCCSVFAGLPLYEDCNLCLHQPVHALSSKA